MESLRKSCTSAPVTCDLLGLNRLERRDIDVQSLSVSDLGNMYLVNCGEGQLRRQTKELESWALPAPVKGNNYVGWLVGLLVCWLVGLLVCWFVGLLFPHCLYFIFQFRCFAIPAGKFLFSIFLGSGNWD